MAEEQCSRWTEILSNVLESREIREIMNVKSSMVTIVKGDTVKATIFVHTLLLWACITELQVKDHLWFMRVALMGVVITIAPLMWNLTFSHHYDNYNNYDESRCPLCMSYQLRSHGVGKVATCAVNKSAKLQLATVCTMNVATGWFICLQISTSGNFSKIKIALATMHTSEVHVCYTTAAQLNWMMIQCKYWEQVGKLFSAAKGQKKIFYNSLDEAKSKAQEKKNAFWAYGDCHIHIQVFHSGYWLNWLRLNMSRNSTDIYSSTL